MENQILSNLRLIRNHKGYSQEYIGQRLGISQNSYHKLESGKTILSAEKLRAIADIYEMDIDEIEGYSIQKEEIIEPPEEMKKRINRLEEDVNFMKNMLSNIFARGGG